MVDRTADYFPSRISQYVPDLAYVADVTNNARQMRVEFGAPPAISTNVFQFTAATSAQVVTTGLPVQISGPGQAAKWGRCITIVGSTAAANAPITIIGRDYLGQRMSVVIAALTGVTVITGTKAWAWIDQINAGINANATDLITIGTTDKLGLPFASVILSGSLIDGLSATAFTFVARDGTTPATSATTDPRGTVLPGTATNGVRTYAAIVQLDTRNLHGVRQFAA
jgi:hypothetical protein